MPQAAACCLVEALSDADTHDEAIVKCPDAIIQWILTWCQQAGFLLGGVLAEHPGMKPVVVAEVQRFLFRPGLQERARYYAVVFLNQLQLSHHPVHGAAPLPHGSRSAHAASHALHAAQQQRRRQWHALRGLGTQSSSGPG